MVMEGSVSAFISAKVTAFEEVLADVIVPAMVTAPRVVSLA